MGWAKQDRTGAGWASLLGVFSVNIHFGGGVTERISTTGGGGVMEGELAQDG